MNLRSTGVPFKNGRAAGCLSDQSAYDELCVISAHIFLDLRARSFYNLEFNPISINGLMRGFAVSNTLERGT